MTAKTRVAIDAMGGDFAPYEITKGALHAAYKLGLEILLCGEQTKIQEVIELCKKEDKALADFLNNNPLSVKIIHAPDEIGMDEKNPARAVRAKKDASVVRANNLVASGEADAVIAAGNTGVATVASLFELKRINGFERPCIATTLPTNSDKKMLLIDAGSNVDAKASHLIQNALLGKILIEALYSEPNARIGLLNIGEEPGKGSELYKESYELLEVEKSKLGLNFVGNVEPKTIINNNCDVAICDGFVGNIHLKALEGGLKMLSNSFKEEFKSPLGIIAGLIFKFTGALKRIKAKYDPNSYGGSLLGGLQHISIISHGSSNYEAIYNAAKHADELHQADVIKKIKAGLEQVS